MHDLLNPQRDVPLVKRSMRILGHRTSIALEPVFWRALEKLAREEGVSLPVFIGEIDKKLTGTYNRSSALRVYIMLAKE